MKTTMRNESLKELSKIKRNSNKNIESSNIFETTGKLLSVDETINDKYNSLISSSENDVITRDSNINIPDIKPCGFDIEIFSIYNNFWS